MKLTTLFHLSLREAIANRKRFSLLVLVDIAALCVMSVSISYGHAVDQCINYFLETRGTRLCNVFSWANSPRNGRPITLDDLAMLRASVGSEALFSGLLQVGTLSISAGDRSINAKVLGEDPPFLTNPPVSTLIGAQDLSGVAAVCVIDEQAAKQLFHDRSSANGLIRINGIPFTCKGVVSFSASSSHMGTVWIPLTTAMRRVQNRDDLDQIYFRVAEGINMEEAISRVRTILRERHHLRAEQPDDFFMMSPIFIRNSFLKATWTTRLACWVATAISGLLALWLGAVLMIASVKQDENLIGLKRALGATRGAIMFEYLLTSLLVVFLAFLLATPVLGYALNVVRKFPHDIVSPWGRISLTPDAICASFIFALLAGSIAALMAARQVTQECPSGGLHK
jgi:putative ABC transport system permease protein